MDAAFFEACQNISQKILFTATKHSRSKNGRFDPSACPRPMKNRGAKGENLHITPTSVHVFRFYFATFRVSVSTPKNKKSTPNFSAALTFFSQRSPFFLLKSNQLTDNQPFSKPSQNSRFFVQKFFREEFSNNT